MLALSRISCLHFIPPPTTYNEGIFPFGGFIFLAVFYKNIEQLDEILDEINSKFGGNIKERVILPIIGAQYFGKRYLSTGKEKKFIEPILREKPKRELKLDEIDHKILQTLSINARIRIIDLADRLKISKDIIKYRLRKLIKEGVAQRFTLDLGHEKFGNSFFKILINLIYDANEREFLSTIVPYNNLVKSMRVLGSWNLEFDFEVQNNLEMRKIVKEIKEKLGKQIENIDSMFVYHIDKLSFYPF